MTDTLSRRDLLLLFGLGLALNLAAAFFVRQPGYMDAYYYFGGARELVRGHGFTEPYLWNYLDNPTSLPHPSHLYWMPLTSIVAAAPMFVLGDSFRAAQLPFLLLAALLPPLSAALAWRIAGHRDRALTAGLLAAFPGFYFTFWPNTDAFALFGLLGAGALIAAWRGGETGRARWWLLAGLLAGLAHLSRADGILLLAIVLLLGRRKKEGGSFLLPTKRSFFLSVIGYLLIMFPWLLRNYLTTGSVLAPGGSAAVWMRNYDELFNLKSPVASLYFSQGLSTILAAKWNGLVANLQTALAVQGMIFLWPFALLGARRVKWHPPVKLGGLYYAALFLAMTFVFTFPGSRGGLFHSGTVILPFVFALAPSGIVSAVEWLAARRKSWNVAVASRVFMGGAVILSALVTFVIFQFRVLGPDWRRPIWNQADSAYAEAGRILPEGAVVAVNDPPGFTYHTGHPAIVIPNGPPADLLTAADRFGARYVLLEANHPASLDDLYLQIENVPRLWLSNTLEDEQGRAVFLYEVRP